MSRKDFIIRKQREYEMYERSRVSNKWNNTMVVDNIIQPKPTQLPQNIQQLVKKADPNILRIMLDRDSLIRLGISTK